MNRTYANLDDVGKMEYIITTIRWTHRVTTRNVLNKLNWINKNYILIFENNIYTLDSVDCTYFENTTKHK